MKCSYSVYLYPSDTAVLSEMFLSPFYSTECLNLFRMNRLQHGHISFFLLTKNNLIVLLMDCTSRRIIMFDIKCIQIIECRVQVNSNLNLSGTLVKQKSLGTTLLLPHLCSSSYRNH